MSKYKNKKEWHDGIEFDAIKEGDYYLYLKQLQEQGEISNLQMQVPFEVIPAVKGMKLVHLKTKIKEKEYCIQRATYYVADFVYVETKTGKKMVVDVKSEITRKNAQYILKKKMMLAYKGINIIEI